MSPSSRSSVFTRASSRVMSSVLSSVLSAVLISCVTPKRTESQSCIFNDDCASPLVCAARQCRAPCADDRDCSGGWRCRSTETAGVRVCLPGPAVCQFASDCGDGGWFCVDGLCERSCSSASDCEAGQACGASGRCEAAVTRDASAMDSDAASASDGASIDGSSVGADGSSAVSIRSLCASGRRTCALSNEGRVYCWGASNGGGLGYVDTMARGVATPTLVNLPRAATMIRCPATDGPFSTLPPDTHTCAVLDDRTLACWGDNSSGQANPGMPTNRPALPAVIAGIRDVVEVATGQDFTCVLDGAGAVRCFGSNQASQLGTPSDTDAGSTGILPEPASTITAGARWGCARALSRSAVYCWGGVTQFGAVDPGSERASLFEFAGQQPSDGIAWISGGRLALFGLSPSGALVSIGASSDGVLGVPGATASARLVAVHTAGAVYDLSVGTAHACALLFDGTLQCWGSNNLRQLGTNTGTLNVPPGALVPLRAVIAVATGYEHTCAALSDGSVWCWGSGAFGALGDNTMGSRAEPRRVQF